MYHGKIYFETQELLDAAYTLAVEHNVFVDELESAGIARIIRSGESGIIIGLVLRPELDTTADKFIYDEFSAVKTVIGVNCKHNQAYLSRE